MQHHQSYRSLISGKCFNFDWYWDGMGGAGLGETIRRPQFPQVISPWTPIGPSQLSFHHPYQSLKHLPGIRTCNASTAALHLSYFQFAKKVQCRTCSSNCSSQCCTTVDICCQNWKYLTLISLGTCHLKMIFFSKIKCFILSTYHLDRVFHIKLEIQQ